MNADRFKRRALYYIHAWTRGLVTSEEACRQIWLLALGIMR